MTFFALCIGFIISMWGLNKMRNWWYDKVDRVDRMDIWIGFNRVKTKVIEWADVGRTKPIAFFATCPSCRCKQWAKVDYLYRGADGTKLNLRCKKCGVGKPKPGDWQRRSTDSFKSFSPKGTGWKSINNNATPSTLNKQPDKDQHPS